MSQIRKCISHPKHNINLNNKPLNMHQLSSQLTYQLLRTKQIDKKKFIANTIIQIKTLGKNNQSIKKIKKVNSTSNSEVQILNDSRSYFKQQQQTMCESFYSSKLSMPLFSNISQVGEVSQKIKQKSKIETLLGCFVQKCYLDAETIQKTKNGTIQIKQLADMLQSKIKNQDCQSIQQTQKYFNSQLSQLNQNCANKDINCKKIMQLEDYTKNISNLYEECKLREQMKSIQCEKLRQRMIVINEQNSKLQKSEAKWKKRYDNLDRIIKDAKQQMIHFEKVMLKRQKENDNLYL